MPQAMRYLRTQNSTMLSSLRSIAAPLDACWWAIGCGGLRLTKDFLERLKPHQWTEQEAEDYWMSILDDYVVQDTPIGRVGKPGFFTRLGDSVDFSWTYFFVIEGNEMPLQSLEEAQEIGEKVGWMDPFEGLPPDVVLVARDIDHAYQDYGFRDEWMFETVRADLLARGLRAEEVTQW